MPDSRPQIIDPQAFDEAKTMMQQKFPTIIGYFLEDTRLYIDTIREGLEKHQAGIVVTASHTIKSSARQIGAFTLANYAAAIEETARHCVLNDNDFDILIQKSEDIETIFQATEREIKARA